MGKSVAVASLLVAGASSAAAVGATVHATNKQERLQKRAEKASDLQAQAIKTQALEAEETALASAKKQTAKRRRSATKTFLDNSTLASTGVTVLGG